MQYTINVRAALLLSTLLLLLLATTLQAETEQRQLPELTAGEEIQVGSDQVSDQQVQQRLQDLLHTVELLADIKVEVSAGRVTLTGLVGSADARDQAIELARRIDGVVSVQDRIEMNADVSERLGGVWNKLAQRLNELMSNIPLLIISLLIVAAFWVLGKFITTREGVFRRLTNNTFLQVLLKQLVFGVTLLAGFVLALEVLDATALLGTILGAAGIFGLAIGFAIRDTVENYIASILLSVRQPFEPKDHIVIDGNEGKVVKLTSRDTVLMTLDGNHVRIPNATVYKGNILNYSRNSKRRFMFEVGIDTSVNIAAANELARDVLSETPGVLTDPPPSSLVKILGESNVVLGLSAWTDQDQFDFGKVRSEAIKNIKESFDAADFEMPEPIYRLRIQNGAHGLLKDQDVTNVELSETTPSSASSFRSTQVATKSKSGIDKTVDVSKDQHIDDEINKEKLHDVEADLLQNND